MVLRALGLAALCTFTACGGPGVLVPTPAASVDAGVSDAASPAPTGKPSQPPSNGQPPKPVPLTDDTVDAFVEFVGIAVRDQQGFIRDEIEKSKSSKTILDKLFQIQDKWWRMDGDNHVVSRESNYTIALFDVIKQFRSADAVPRLVGFVWRPLPQGGGHLDSARVDIEVREAAAAEALGCAPGAEAEVQKVVASHPSVSVRDAAAQQRSNQWCRFNQTATNP